MTQNLMWPYCFWNCRTRAHFLRKSKPIVGFVQRSPQASEELKKELALHVHKEIGPIAVPDKIQFAPGLPKTRSGKIMRRILRKIAENQTDQIGDTTTLADPHVVEALVKGKQ